MKKVLVLALALTGSLFGTVGVKAEETHSHEISSAPENIEVSYSMDGMNVIETTVLYENNTELLLLRCISPDGLDIIEVYEDDALISTLSAYNNNYDEFFALANPQLISNVSIEGIAAPNGSDLTGTQYTHVYVGHTSTSFENSYLAQLMVAGVGMLAAHIMSKLGVPSSVADGIATVFFTYVGYVVPDSAYMSKYLYEVRTSYDGTYLMHCYHTYVWVDGSSYWDYYQAIGG